MTDSPAAPRSRSFTPQCVSIDLEVGINDGRIHQFAAVRGDTSAAYVHDGRGQKDLDAALDQLDAFSASARFVLGHNIVAFDLPHLAALRPDLRLLQLPAVDTLCLNPLAFPRNPYHHLVKHYQDGQIKRGRVNDPELDARLALRVFFDQHDALLELRQSAPDLLRAWHWLTTVGGPASGLDNFFKKLRDEPRPDDQAARAAMDRLLDGQACMTHGQRILDAAATHGWALAYVFAWLSVAGGNSVMPPWVRHQYPEAGRMVRLLRDTACSAPDCAWCGERHNARRELQRWFPGLDDFRPEPVDERGAPLQRSITEAAMRGEHVLGILPTGTGKSICYQLPALSRFEKTGALTVVVSPLVALMSDQVAGLEARGIHCCAALNGLLSMPERAEVLERVRLGDIGILIVSPEQLRSTTLRRAIEQREIGAWVLDEAHCLSKWGHDFRPDYRYVSRYMQERAGAAPLPPVLCLTATAKPDVVHDIVGHFRDKVGIELKTFDGGTSRDNLDFAVVQTTVGEKFAHIHQILLADLPARQAGGAIIYCSTRKSTEEVASFLVDKGITAGYFHAGLAPETKKSVQTRFINGELRVIAATNAFGMGIDKPDVRLVIHADIPGSLENYLQEAGRAGRDRAAARCVLLYTAEDVERQFGMSARSRLTQPEIQSILRALRKLDRKKRLGGEIVATPGEILAEDEGRGFERESATDDTRVRTAISWLEEAHLLTREENNVRVFPSSLRIATIDEARAKLVKVTRNARYRDQLLALVDVLINARPDDGISTDELMDVAGLTAADVRVALNDLEQAGIASNDTSLTAFVHHGVEHSSKQRMDEALALETALLALLREAAPDLGRDQSAPLHLRLAAQRLKDAGHAHALPERLMRILRSLARDGADDNGGGRGSINLRSIDAELVDVTLRREWPALEITAQRRRTAAKLLLDHLLDRLPPGARGTDLLAETTMGGLLAAITDDLVLNAEFRNPVKLLDHGLLWLHEQEAIRLNKGLAVFRPAMTIKLDTERRGTGFVKADFASLELHYSEQVVQIHVMAEYVQRGLQAMADALRLALDYFALERDAFMQRWLPDRDKDLQRQTTPESWQAIVGGLGNSRQQHIVADDREQTNVLVLAGPGSGKTRVLVHRIAYLVRVRRQDARGILALAYNRHAAVEIRRRLDALIGPDARGVTVLTCHALAMRLAGVSFEKRGDAGGQGKDDGLDDRFKEVLRQAIALLKGDGLASDEADEQRDRLLAGFRWILVDEYQDVTAEQYDLISALAGRTLQDEERKLSLFAVGDDDQNIYAFNGASVEFIRRFEKDYGAKAAFLTDNYRSSAHIIAAANRVIEAAADRMKSDHPITIDRARRKLPPGGAWRTRDPVGQGRVQILSAPGDPVRQAIAVMTELSRLAALDTQWTWSRCAVIARGWDELEPVRAWCELHGIPAQLGVNKGPRIWRLRETQALLDWVHAEHARLVDAPAVRVWLDGQRDNPWWTLLRDAVDTYADECGLDQLPTAHFTEWLAEWAEEARRRQNGLLLLTAHSAKGLEFDHVAVLDDKWSPGRDEDVDSPRRLYYVAMTRARQTLLLVRASNKSGRHFCDALTDADGVVRRTAPTPPAPVAELMRRHVRPGPKDIYLDYPGLKSPRDAVHHAIKMLSPGDILQYRLKEERPELADAQGVTVVRMAKSYAPDPNMECLHARVLAIEVRRRADPDESFKDRVKCDRWEIVIPELVLVPRESTG